MKHFYMLWRSLTASLRKALAAISAFAIAFQMLLVGLPVQPAQATYTPTTTPGIVWDDFQAPDTGVLVPGSLLPATGPVVPAPGVPGVSDVGLVDDGLGAPSTQVTAGNTVELAAAHALGVATSPVIVKPTGSTWDSFDTVDTLNLGTMTYEFWDSTGTTLLGSFVSIGGNQMVDLESTYPALIGVDSIIIRTIFTLGISSPSWDFYSVDWIQAQANGPYIQAPLTVNFDGATPTPSVGDQIGVGLSGESFTGEQALYYMWDFGDASSSACTTTSTASHTYAANGTYTATLTVSHDLTCTTPINTNTALVSVGQFDLSIDKTINSSNGPLVSVLPGDVQTVGLIILNNGLTDAFNVVLSDVLPGTLQFFGYPFGPPHCVGDRAETSFSDPGVGNNGTVTFNFDTVASGDNILCYFLVQVPNPTLDLTTFNNVATITATGWNDPVNPTDFNQANNTDSVSETVDIPTLEVSKTLTLLNGNPAPLITQAQPGDNLTYQISVHNPGSGSAVNVDYHDLLPMRSGVAVTGINLGTSSSSCAPFTATDPTFTSPNILDWTYADTILGGTTCTLTYTVRVNSQIDQSAIYSNTGSATGMWFDSTPIPADGNAAGYFDTNVLTPAASDTDPNDSAQAAFVAQEPALVTTKTVDTSACSSAPLCAFGDTVTFTSTVTNVGDGTAFNVFFTDDPQDCIASYVPGSSTITYPDTSTDTNEPITSSCGVGTDVANWTNSLDAMLTPGQTVSLTWSMQIVDPTIVNGSAHTDIAGVYRTLISYPFDGFLTEIPANNSADVPADIDIDDLSSASFTVVAPVITVDKVITAIDGDTLKTVPEIGSIISYQVTVSNTGSATAWAHNFFDMFDSTSGKLMEDPADYAGGSGPCSPGEVNGTFGGTFSGFFGGGSVCSGGSTPTPSWTGLGINLAPGEFVTLAFNAQVQFPPTTSPFGDTVTNDIGDNWCIDSSCLASVNSTDSITTAYVGPDLGIIKGPSDSDVEATQQFTWELDVMNFGTGNAYNVEIADAIPAGLTYVPGSSVFVPGCVGLPTPLADPAPNYVLGTVAPGVPYGCILFDTTVGIPASVNDANIITNSATLSGEFIDGTAISNGFIVPMTNSASVTAHVPDLDVTKSADTTACTGASLGGPAGTCVPGDTVTWTIDTLNPASNSATPDGQAYNVTVSDTLPTGFTYVPSSTTGCTTSDPSISGSTLTWTVGNILPQATCSVTFGTSIGTNVKEANNPYNNSATSTGFYLDGTTPIIDTGSADTNVATVDIATFDPAVTKTGSVSSANPGDTVVFTITATNNGTLPGTGVVVTDPIPSILEVTGTTCVTCDTATTVVGNTVSFNIGVLSPAEVVTMTVTTRVRAGAAQGTVTNTTTLTSDTATTAVTSSFGVLSASFSLLSTGASTLLLLGLSAGLTIVARKRKTKVTA